MDACPPTNSSIRSWQKKRKCDHRTTGSAEQPPATLRRFRFAPPASLRRSVRCKYANTRMPATINNPRNGKIGLALSLVAMASLITGSFMRPVGGLVAGLVGPLILPISLIGFVLSCIGLSKDQVKRFAITGCLISLASLTWLLILVIISVFNH